MYKINLNTEGDFLICQYKDKDLYVDKKSIKNFTLSMWVIYKHSTRTHELQVFICGRRTGTIRTSFTMREVTETAIHDTFWDIIFPSYGIPSEFISQSHHFVSLSSILAMVGTVCPRRCVYRPCRPETMLDLGYSSSDESDDSLPELGP